ncbi:MAG: alpha-glucan family phosphorylase, partial [Chlamydiales bacterium]|nr:alpha-glucan family phosphorylase [Chlamydiales bacterium]
QPLRGANGEWLRIEVSLPGWSLWLRAWEAKVGRIKLYLLDSNDIVNYPVYRGITSELYGGDLEMRLRQELVLGLGGVRLLEQLGIQAEICHLNEGHAAFAILERVRLCMQEYGLSFDEALSTMRSSHIFTTHTAVPAGFDRFPNDLILKYLGNYATHRLSISCDRLLELGKDGEGWFNTAYLAIRGSSFVNAVSRLHGHVSRYLFSSLFPRFPVNEVPVGSITNGIHTPSWVSAPAERLWSEQFDKPHTDSEAETNVCRASDAQIWAMRSEARAQMIDYGRKQILPILEARGVSQEEIAQAKSSFNSSALTLGFARRFATYKRPNMLLFDPERLVKILTNPDKPVQLIIAGKAHPADEGGQAMIREWIHFIKRPEVRSRILFLTDYDMLMAEQLVQGVDVWINTPRRPWEACGTSGMKVLVNGGLNLSELDGWWAEAYSSEVGWALGDGKEHGDDLNWDAREAVQLYDLLEQQVIPEFYQRNGEGVPEAWIHRIRESMTRLTPLFCAHRAVREYTEKHYLPAARKYRKRVSDQAVLGKKIAAQQELWKNFSVTSPFKESVITPLERQYHVKVRVDLGGLDPATVRLEMYAEETPPFRQDMQLTDQSGSIYSFETKIPNNLPASHYCARILPVFPDANLPLEAPYVVWEK